MTNIVQQMLDNHEKRNSNNFDDINKRAEHMIKTEAPIQLIGMEKSIHFLRGVFSRVSFCLPAFYYLLGSASIKNSVKDSDNHLLLSNQAYFEFSSLNTLTLACRKIFDHANDSNLTGANFGKTSDAVLEEHAAYWSTTSPYSKEEAFIALKFLRQFFTLCSKTDSKLLKENSFLQKRIGLLKQHANRAAAHLSLENYSIDIIDVAHFTASCVLVGEIIRRFDQYDLGESYFNDVDATSYQAAEKVFPDIAKFRLFVNMKVAQQVKYCFRWEEDHGMEMLLNQLQYAIGGEP